MTHTIASSVRANEELHLSDLDAIVGGGQITSGTQQAGAGKTPNLLVVIAIIAILIG
jgi:hypothetical protein